MIEPVWLSERSASVDVVGSVGALVRVEWHVEMCQSVVVVSVVVVVVAAQVRPLADGD